MASLNLRTKPHGFNKRNNKNKFIIPAIIVIVLAAIFLLTFNGVTTITQSQSFTLSQGKSMQFKLQSSSVFSIYLSSSSSQSASISVSQSPVLSSPIISLIAIKGSTYNISTYGSNNANLQIKFMNGNATTSIFLLTPVPSGLSIPVSSSVNINEPSQLPLNISNEKYTTIETTTVNNNTSKNNTTVKVTTSQSTATTTTAPTQISQSIITDASNSYIGTLVSNLNVLYAEENQCTSTLYNQTLSSYAHQSAVGPFSYSNVTLVTPTDINSTITGPFSYGYLVVYSSKSHSKETTGPAISMEINGSSGTASNIKFSGIFLGQNYTDIENSYNFQNSIGNACAAYIPHS